MTHTPGPWDYDEELQRITALDNGNCRVLRAMAYGGSKEEAASNAHLIAAAPELLKALKDITKTIAPYSNLSSTPVFEKAKEAIAKAEGR